jgi:hypothetical protein
LRHAFPHCAGNNNNHKQGTKSLHNAIELPV